MEERNKFIKKQESPPAWTQEAYRPRRIKYSICYPRWGTPRWGNPQPGVMGYLRWVPPIGWLPSGYPLWGPPGQVWQGGTWGGVPPVGVPPVRSNGGYLRWGTPVSGYPLARSDRGVPEVGYPPVGVPPVRSNGGYLRYGTPCQGTPWPALIGGYLRWGTPLLGYPQARSNGGTQGGVPPVRVPPIRSKGGYLRWCTPQPGATGGPKVGYPPIGIHPSPWLAGPGRGTPRRCGLTNKVKLLPPVSYYICGR